MAVQGNYFLRFKRTMYLIEEEEERTDRRYDVINHEYEGDLDYPYSFSYDLVDDYFLIYDW